MSDNEALVLRSVSKAFDRIPVVENVSFSVKDGDLAALLGPSGCGKTTLLRMIAGLETPDAGEISLDGKRLSRDRPPVFVPPNRRGIGMVFQDYALWPHMTVERTISYPLRVARGRHRGGTGYRTVDEVLKQVRLGSLERRYPHQLSGGEQQRVALARALVMRPKLLLLDEPLSNLDAQLRKEMRVELKRVVNATGVTVLHVTHDQAEALAIADRLIVMSRGRIEQTGTAEELYEAPSTSFVARFVGDANLLDATLAAGGGSGLRLADGAVVETSGETVETKESESGLFAVHPHDILLIRGGGTPGVVVERGYMGEAWHYVVRVGETTLRVQAPIQDVYEVGNSVGVQLRHAAGVRISPSSAAHPETRRGAAGERSGRRGERHSRRLRRGHRRRDSSDG